MADAAHTPPPSAASRAAALDDDVVERRTLRDYYVIVRERLWIALPLALIAAIGFAYYKSRAVPLYQSTASAKARILGSVAFAYSAPQQITKNDPSNLKRFVSMTPSGKFRVYIVPDVKRTIITVEHYSSLVATRTVGISSITPTFT